MQSLIRASTGLDELDKVIDSLRLGDNVLWQVETIEEYCKFTGPFVKRSLSENRKVIYMRFGEHKPVIDNYYGITVYELDSSGGFEAFSVQVYDIITREGREAYYVFDCLSDLLPVWASDLMIGNFFVITCPYLFELDTIAYFCILRNNHSFATVARIRETTQLLIDIYHNDDRFYVHPLKVWNRYSSTMFLPHGMDGDDLSPITSSIDIAKLLALTPLLLHESEKRNLDYWDRLFLNASDLFRRAQEGDSIAREAQEMVFERLCRLIIGRDERILRLAGKYFTLKDLLDIKARLLGSGFIGGKAVGMLLARSILLSDPASGWENYLEPHDSFYIGSDVFYSYIVENGWWKLRMKQRSKTGYFEAASELKEKFLGGSFPAPIRERFQQVLEYFGQSPFIVRSSSLLEDAFGNAFAGKYESVFCVNQGTPGERYNQFEDAIKKVYASTMDEDALFYRLQRGLDLKDEQMAILVQRVSGASHNGYFFPDLAGVGVSYNTYVWNSNMDPAAGMLRLVFGLGTRAVDRVEGDYPRIVALDTPLLQPHAGLEDVRKYSQHDMDVLNISENKWETISVSSLLYEGKDNIMKLIGVRDYTAMDAVQKLGLKGYDPWILTFDALLSDTKFASVFHRMLKSIEAAYEYPVDLEFTVNFNGDIPNINLVQCRPLQVKGMKKQVALPGRINNKSIVFQSGGNFMGGNISQSIDLLIHVVPEEYIRLDMTQKYEIAHLIGRINKKYESREKMSVMLTGPGRWGTSTPSLGVPVKFSDINNMAVLVEIAFSDAGLMPELSFGTHFFQDLVETDIYYAALFPGTKNTIYNKDRMSGFANMFLEYFPEKAQYEKVIGIYDVKGKGLMLLADIVAQKIVCYFDENSR